MRLGGLFGATETCGGKQIGSLDWESFEALSLICRKETSLLKFLVFLAGLAFLAMVRVSSGLGACCSDRFFWTENKFFSQLSRYLLTLAGLGLDWRKD